MVRAQALFLVACLVALPPGRPKGLHDDCVAPVVSGVAQVLRPAVARSVLERYEFAEPHMGTTIRIVVYASSGAAANDASQAAFARIRQLDDELSDYRESSELVRLSRQAGTGPVKVSDDLFRVLRAAQQLFRGSDGAFDVTVGPLSVIWRRARRLAEMPDAAQLADARRLVGADKLELDDDRRTVRLLAPGMRLDLGGIAKGFAAEEAAGVLRDRGIGAALVAAGGDIVVTGPPPGATGWRVAIASGVDRSPARYLVLHHAAVSTSGDAEQFVVLGGVRYSHIIDPRTGMAIAGHSSATIVAPDGTTADGLATACSVLGWAKGLRLVDATPGAAGLVLEATADGVRTHESAQWNHQPSTIDHGHQPSAIDHQPSTIDHQPSTMAISHQPSAMTWIF